MSIAGRYHLVAVYKGSDNHMVTVDSQKEEDRQYIPEPPDDRHLVALIRVENIGKRKTCLITDYRSTRKNTDKDEAVDQPDQDSHQQFIKNQSGQLPQVLYLWQRFKSADNRKQNQGQ